MLTDRTMSDQGVREPTPRVEYSAASVDSLLQDPRVLAVLEFGRADAGNDPRWVPVALQPWPGNGLREVWHADSAVTSGRSDDISWARSLDWLLVSLRLRDDGSDIRALARHAYARLAAFLRTQPQFHVQRLWNYLDNINAGHGDAERYRQFCQGRLEGMGHFFNAGFPAATGIGHAQPAGHLQIYGLAARAAGQRVENPRQLSAWRYPRQYGPVGPSFARAMRSPSGDALAISGTAAIQGHASRHASDLPAQFDETLLNLRSLLTAADMPPELGPHSPLKVYVRHQQDMATVDALLATHLPQVPRQLLHATICRRELLLEIDGWHFS